TLSPSSNYWLSLRSLPSSPRCSSQRFQEQNSRRSKPSATAIINKSVMQSPCTQRTAMNVFLTVEAGDKLGENDPRLGDKYLPELLEPLLGKNTGSNQLATAGPPGISIYVCPSGLRAKDRAVPGFQTLLKDNKYITYVWNHIYKTADNGDYDNAHPVS